MSTSSHSRQIDRHHRGGNLAVESLLIGIALADSSDIFARNLKFWLKKRELSGAELGRRLGLGRQAVSQWLNQVSGPDLKTIGQVADALEIPITDLFVSSSDRPSAGRPAPAVPSKIEVAEQALKVLAASAGVEISVRPRRKS